MLPPPEVVHRISTTARFRAQDFARELADRLSLRYLPEWFFSDLKDLVHLWEACETEMYFMRIDGIGYCRMRIALLEAQISSRLREEIAGLKNAYLNALSSVADSFRSTSQEERDIIIREEMSDEEFEVIKRKLGL